MGLKATTIVPGHGAVLHDNAYIKLMTRLFASMKQQVEAAVARGETLEQARKSVNLDEFQKLFAGESRMRRNIFSNYVKGAGLAAAFSDASTKKVISLPLRSKATLQSDPGGLGTSMAS